MSSLNDEDRENLAAFLDGELDEEATQAMEAKLSQDSEARAEVNSLKQAWSMLEYLPKVEPSPNFTHRTMERLALASPTVETAKIVPGRPVRWLAGAGWMAAILVAVGLGTWLGNYFFFGEFDEPAVRKRAIENFRLYEQIEDLDFLRGLDQPDLFGKETGS